MSARDDRYNRSEAGRRRQWRYDASEKRRAAHARYERAHPERKRRYHIQPE